MNKQIKVGSLLQYIQIALNIVISIIYTPIMLRILGQSEYGLYSLSSTIISYLSVLSLGLGSAYLRFYSRCKKKDPEKVKTLNGVYLFAFGIIAVLTIICGLVLTTNIKLFLNASYSGSDISTAKILMVVLTINMALSFPMSVFSSYIMSQEKFIFQKAINIGKTVFSPMLSILALLLGYRSIGLVVATVTINLIVDAINILYCFKHLKMKISFKNMSFSMFKEIIIFSSFIALNQIIDQINWETDKIILAKMLNSAAVSIYAIGATFNYYFRLFSETISNLFAPRINKIVADNKEDVNLELTKLMTSIGRVQFMILSLVLSGFIFFGKAFIVFWVGNGYEDSYYIALLLLCPGIIPLIQNAAIEIQRAKNLHKFRTLIYFIMAIFNVGISILFFKLFGIIGVASGTALMLVVADGIVFNIYYHKKMHLNMLHFWKEILKIVPALFIPILCGLLLYFEPIATGFDLVKYIIAYTSVYVVSIMCFGLNKKERDALFNKSIEPKE